MQYMGLTSGKAEFVRDIVHHRRAIKALRAAGFREYVSDHSLDYDEVIAEVRLSPDRREVWIRVEKTD